MFNQKEKINSKLSLDFGPWRFSPNLKLSLITLILLPILAYLGLWQMDRAAYKKNIFAISQKKIEKPIIDLKLIQDPSLEKNRFTPISIEGVFINHHTFLLDNQMLNHKVGFRVLTPVQVPYLDKWVLVDRGWIPQDKNRSKLPQIDSIYGLKYIPGIINTISTGIVLKKDTASSNTRWPLVIQSLNYDFIAKQINHPVFKFVEQLRSDELSHYATPPIDFGASTEKHFVYAAQWFSFAGLLLIYYLIASIKRRN